MLESVERESRGVVFALAAKRSKCKSAKGDDVLDCRAHEKGSPANVSKG